MKIKCTNCGYVEKTDKDFFVKLIGGAMPVGGFWAWTTYLFAGTGFAMAIVVAIIGGGVAMLIFKDEIVEWIINQDYKCPECGEVKWQAYDSDKEVVNTSKSKVVSDNTHSVTYEEPLPGALRGIKSSFLRALYRVARAGLTGFTPEELNKLDEIFSSLDEESQKKVLNKNAIQNLQKLGDYLKTL